MELYHLSEHDLNGKTLTPRVPQNFLVKHGFEDAYTKRVCFASNIKYCLRAFSQNLTGKKLYVYQPSRPIKYIIPTKDQVPDSTITHEIWVTEPVKLKKIGQIKVTGDTGEDGLKYTYGKNNEFSAELYDWNYIWINKYTIRKENNQMNRNLGYIINESGISLNRFEVFNEATVPSSIPKGINLKHHSPDRLIGYGVLQTADEKNRNGRIYKKEDLAREIKAPRQQELLEAGQLCGETGHPLGSDAASLARQQTIDPKYVCVRFLKLWMEGNNVYGCFEGTNNAAGETFDKDLRIGITPAFSLRALGMLKSTPQGAVVEGLKMITYDYVIFPSHKGAYTIGIINESANISPSSGFNGNHSMDATKSYIKEFNNNDAVGAVQQYAIRESAIDYVKSSSSNFKMLKEYFDMNRFDTADLINAHQIAFTESGNKTIVMNIDDYIAKELQNYI